MIQQEQHFVDYNPCHRRVTTVSDNRLSHMELVVEKIALKWDFPKYFSFTAQLPVADSLTILSQNYVASILTKLN
jgi:hypothetical protein